MSRKLAQLTLDNVKDLPPACRACVVWESDPTNPNHPTTEDDAILDKEAWISTTLLQWGSCGLLAYVDEELVGYLTYAPPEFAPRSRNLATSPVSPDAVLLMTGGVLPAHRGGGIARMLAQGVAKDLTRRGVRAIECFATTHNASPDLGCTPGCLLPAPFLLAVGFKTVKAHRDTPRLRLELRTAVSWREDVEHALTRILGTVRMPALASQITPRPE